MCKNNFVLKKTKINLLERMFVFVDLKENVCKITFNCRTEIVEIEVREFN